MSNKWTSKEKKHSVIIKEIEGRKVQIPIMEHLKTLALTLPPMKRGKRRVIHFNELKRVYMASESRDHAMHLINRYCIDMNDIYRKATAPNEKPAIEAHEEAGLKNDN